MEIFDIVCRPQVKNHSSMITTPFHGPLRQSAALQESIDHRLKTPVLTHPDGGGICTDQIATSGPKSLPLCFLEESLPEGGCHAKNKIDLWLFPSFQ